ncbi:MAG: dockerin type I repeat-containing protein [Oscillospiraceae bacterium]|nr:dockerin type I repeat-containing protein [Oscillospiraceae bacterium]
MTNTYISKVISLIMALVIMLTASLSSVAAESEQGNVVLNNDPVPLFNGGSAPANGTAFFTFGPNPRTPNLALMRHNVTVSTETPAYATSDLTAEMVEEGIAALTFQSALDPDQTGYSSGIRLSTPSTAQWNGSDRSPGRPAAQFRSQMNFAVMDIYIEDGGAQYGRLGASIVVNSNPWTTLGNLSFDTVRGGKVIMGERGIPLRKYRLSFPYAGSALGSWAIFIFGDGSDYSGRMWVTNIGLMSKDELMELDDFDITFGFYKKGNPTGNGEVSVADVILARDFIFRRLPEIDNGSSKFEAMDMNNDGMIDIFDLIRIRDMILR